LEGREIRLRQDLSQELEAGSYAVRVWAEEENSRMSARRKSPNVGEALICGDQEALLLLDGLPEPRILPPTHSLFYDRKCVDESRGSKEGRDSSG
jgi:hypothetical protein